LKVKFPDTLHGELLSRASAAEGGIEAIIVKLATERILDEGDLRTLGLFRQAYQKLREAIRDGRELEWTYGTAEYGLYNELACGCSRIISRNRYIGRAIEEPYKKLERITAIRSADWETEVSKRPPYGSRQGLITEPAQYFRAGAGGVIVNAEGLALALERSDHEGAWQLPQGGLEKEEEPADTLFREIQEETSIARSDLQVLATNPEPLVYELPPGARSSKTGRGQVQYWYLLRFHGSESSIQLNNGGEFRAWKWMPLEQLIDSVVDFRKPVYRQLAERFRDYTSIANDSRPTPG
jgi:putative (di)nucleoside polyphosphate hydrolase